MHLPYFQQTINYINLMQEDTIDLVFLLLANFHYSHYKYLIPLNDSH